MYYHKYCKNSSILGGFYTMQAYFENRIPIRPHFKNWIRIGPKHPDSLESGSATLIIPSGENDTNKYIRLLNERMN